MKDFNLTKYRNMAIALPLAPKSLIIRLIKEPEKTGRKFKTYLKE